MKMKWLAIGAAALLLTGCAAPGTGDVATMTDKQSAWTTISQEQAKARMDSGDPVVVLDVRTQEEYDQGHIANAVLLPLQRIGDSLPAELPDRDAEILVYCRSGNRSRQAAQKLADLGYTAVYNFGGINTWPYGSVTD